MFWGWEPLMSCLVSFALVTLSVCPMETLRNPTKPAEASVWFSRDHVFHSFRLNGDVSVFGVYINRFFSVSNTLCIYRARLVSSRTAGAILSGILLLVWCQKYAVCVCVWGRKPWDHTHVCVLFVRDQSWDSSLMRDMCCDESVCGFEDHRDSRCL